MGLLTNFVGNIQNIILQFFARRKFRFFADQLNTAYYIATGNRTERNLNHIQSNLDISNSDISNSAKLEASI